VHAGSGGGRRAGCLVGFAAQGSIDPPRFLVCISRNNRTFRVAREAEGLAVHFVPASATALAELFGGQTGDEVDKFARCDWSPGPFGAPILAECGNWFAGRVLEELALGDHVGFLLDPVEAQMETPQAEFTFHRARRIEPGHPARRRRATGRWSSGASSPTPEGSPPRRRPRSSGCVTAPRASGLRGAQPSISRRRRCEGDRFLRYAVRESPSARPAPTPLSHVTNVMIPAMTKAPAHRWSELSQARRRTATPSFS